MNRSTLNRVPWERMFAKRAEQMKRTAVRELLKVTARPEIISFAGGLPAAELFPMPVVRSAMDRVFERVGGKSLQYGETEGIGELREWIANFMTSKARGSQAEDLSPNALTGQMPALRSENILITSGAQQALDLIGRVLLEDGDRVIVENPTYLALLSAWRPLGVKFLALPSDSDGLSSSDFEEVLEQRPKLIYLTPNFQNPQGTTVPLARRHELLDLARDRGIGIVEDNPYGDLRYSGEPLPDLLQLELAMGGSDPGPNGVIYTGTFSKVLMPGLRVGWVVASADVIEKLVHAKQAADLHTSSLSQYLALELLKAGFIEEYLPTLKATYGERRDVMLTAQKRYFPGDVSWSRPEGGMFLMVTLRVHMNATALLSKALERGVAYVPGEEFHFDGSGRNTMRLNFSNAAPERIEVGIKRLAEVVKGR